MKLTAGRVDRFIDQDPHDKGVVLLYGPDRGLVTERAARLVARILEDPEDPFRSARLDNDTLAKRPAALLEEAQSLSLTGGRRVVRVLDAGDGNTKAVGALLDAQGHEALVILEGGDLSPGSSLRKLVERSPQAVALPCYRVEGEALAGAIRSMLREEGLTLDNDALAYLLGHVGSDHGVTRGEVAKLALYMAGSEQPVVRLEDVAAVVGDSAALSIDDMVWATLEGRGEAASVLLDRLLAEGQAPVRLVRILAQTIERLLSLRSSVERGLAPANVIAEARPPIHFRYKQTARRALSAWDARALFRALAACSRAEVHCKTTGLPDRLIVRRLFFELGREAEHGPRG